MRRGRSDDGYKNWCEHYPRLASVFVPVMNICFVISYEGVTSADGTLSFDGLAAGDYKITELEAPDGYNMLKDPVNLTITWTAPVAPSTECTWASAGNTVEDGVVKLPIENNTGSTLPSTGGIGTTIFYIVGACLVIGAGVVLITKRRMEG